MGESDLSCYARYTLLGMRRIAASLRTSWTPTRQPSSRSCAPGVVRRARRGHRRTHAPDCPPARRAEPHAFLNRPSRPTPTTRTCSRAGRGPSSIASTRWDSRWSCLHRRHLMPPSSRDDARSARCGSARAAPPYLVESPFYLGLTLAGLHDRASADERPAIVAEVTKPAPEETGGGRSSVRTPYRHPSPLLAAERTRIENGTPDAPLNRGVHPGRARQWQCGGGTSRRDGAGVGSFRIQAARYRHRRGVPGRRLRSHRRWGARPKARALLEAWPHLSAAPATATTLPIDLGQEQLALLLAIKAAAQTISRAVVYDELVRSLVSLMMEHSVLEKGVLLTWRDDRPHVEAIPAWSAPRCGWRRTRARRRRPQSRKGLCATCPRPGGRWRFIPPAHGGSPATLYLRWHRAGVERCCLSRPSGTRENLALLISRSPARSPACSHRSVSHGARVDRVQAAISLENARLLGASARLAKPPSRPSSAGRSSRDMHARAEPIELEQESSIGCRARSCVRSSPAGARSISSKTAGPAVRGRARRSPARALDAAALGARSSDCHRPTLRSKRSGRAFAGLLRSERRRTVRAPRRRGAGGARPDLGPVARW